MVENADRCLPSSRDHNEVASAIRPPPISPSAAISRPAAISQPPIMTRSSVRTITAFADPLNLQVAAPARIDSHGHRSRGANCAGRCSNQVGHLLEIHSYGRIGNQLVGLIPLLREEAISSQGGGEDSAKTGLPHSREGHVAPGDRRGLPFLGSRSSRGLAQSA